MAAIQSILAAYCATSQTERENGSYFEELIRTFFRFSAVKTFADLMAFFSAGRDLVPWHLNYDTVAHHPGKFPAIASPMLTTVSPK